MQSPITIPAPQDASTHRWWRTASALVLLVLTGCASLPAPSPRTQTPAIAASVQTDLGALAHHASAQAYATRVSTSSQSPVDGPKIPDTYSGLRPMPEPQVALDARLTLIRRAQSSLDLQYYLVGNDDIGHLLLRELRDAAERGVRVRLLIDDFYTVGMDPLLLGLAAHPNAEVRLFNPFPNSRNSATGRLLSMAFDFKRLNHRMHNKLFIADGAMAIAGGRNMADGYFLRSQDTFIDFDVLMLGPIVAQLQSIFDTYWNSHHVYAIADVAHSAQTPASLRASFAQTVRHDMPAPKVTPHRDAYGVPLLSLDLAASLQKLVWAQAEAFADNPDKIVHGVTHEEVAKTALSRSVGVFREARSELMLFSPYFVPGTFGMAGLAEARRNNVPVRVVTNSMATTDEPLASLAYERYRIPLLKMGVELYELQPMPGSQDARERLGSSRARWHAKMAFVDRKTVVLGSMNLDQRSATTNTELGVLIRSPEFANQVLSYFNSTRAEDVNHVYQVKLRSDGETLEWVLRKGKDGVEVLESEPDMDYLLRLKLFILSPFVAEGLL